MKKLFFYFVFVLLSFGLCAQIAPQQVKKLYMGPGTGLHNKSGQVDTLNSDLWGIGNWVLFTTSEGGYVSGHNGYADMAQMQRFDCTAPFNLTQLLFWFGTKQGTGAVTVTIWADSNGIPGVPLRRTTLPISDIDTSGIFDVWTVVDINPDLSFPEFSTFWAGLEYFNSSPGDTVALVMMDGYTAADSMTFIQRFDSSYHSMWDLWGLETALFIAPVVEYQPALGIIHGTVFIDDDSDGIKDSSEAGLPHQLVRAGNYYATTDFDGVYNIDIYTAGQYAVKHLVQGYLTSAVDSIMVTVSTPGSLFDSTDFPCQIIPDIRDLAVSITPSNFRPGFQSYYWLSCINQGTQVENGAAYLTFDNQLQLDSTNPAPDTISGNTLIWNFTSLLPGETRNIAVTMETPVSVPLGTMITATASIIPSSGDTALYNNFTVLTHEIIGSYDPNDKSVFPKGDGVEGYLGDSLPELEYTIRFQNTGTDTAFNIVLKDTLDADLDVNTLKVICASHANDYILTSDRLLTIRFSNILLPDSGTNQEASNGFFKFSIAPKNALEDGTQLINYADIYFDFNVPVTTNSVMNTIGKASGIEEAKTYRGTLKIQPNPASNYLYIITETDTPITYEIYNLMGARLASGTLIGRGKKMIDIKTLSSGTYLLRMMEGASAASGVFIKVAE